MSALLYHKIEQLNPKIKDFSNINDPSLKTLTADMVTDGTALFKKSSRNVLILVVTVGITQIIPS